ncbi:MAG: hypothetical protein QM589_00640 [Thermomicrobiales bacterium]
MEQMRPIGYWVKRLDRALEARFERTLAAQGLSRRHWQVLNALREDVRTEGEIVRMLEPFWTEDAITWEQVKADLLSRGLIAMADGLMIELTSAGVALHGELGKQVSDTRTVLMQGISNEEYLATIRVLERMAENVEGA